MELSPLWPHEILLLKDTSDLHAIRSCGLFSLLFGLTCQLLWPSGGLEGFPIHRGCALNLEDSPPWQQEESACRLWRDVTPPWRRLAVITARETALGKSSETTSTSGESVQDTLARAYCLSQQCFPKASLFQLSSLSLQSGPNHWSLASIPTTHTSGYMASWLRPMGPHYVCTQLLSHMWLFPTPWTVAHKTLLSMGFFRQEYWSG